MGGHGSDVELSFFRIEYAFLMNDLIATAVSDSTQSLVNEHRL